MWPLCVLWCWWPCCLHSWALPSFTHTPFDIQRTQVLNTFFFTDVVFLFAHNPLHPVPSCYFDLCFKIQYLSSPLNMILWHNFVSCRKEPDLFSKHCAQTLQKKNKIAMVVTYVFQTSGLKAKKKKKSSVSSHVFWSEAWQSKTEIWTMRLLHGDICLRQP